MPTDSRTYIRVHDGMPDHPKIAGLSDRAFRTLIETWCWCSRYLTDGVIPAVQWRRIGTPKSRKELENFGLVDAVDDTFHVRNYLAFQRSAAEVAELRETRRNAGAKGGRAKAARLANALANAKANGKQPPSKNVPDTETEELEESSSKPRLRGERLPDDWKPTAADVERQRTEGISDDLARREYPKFCDYWRAKPGKDGCKLDWSATWRNWLRAAVERNGTAPRDFQAERERQVQDRIRARAVDPLASAR
jgi:hypothetical protein